MCFFKMEIYCLKTSGCNIKKTGFSFVSLLSMLTEESRKILDDITFITILQSKIHILDNTLKHDCFFSLVLALVLALALPGSKLTSYTS